MVAAGRGGERRAGCNNNKTCGLGGREWTRWRQQQEEGVAVRWQAAAGRGGLEGWVSARGTRRDMKA
ncbi:hypothetical protein BGW80DRAFT_1319580 [Lactifluus volemus]|nr:hypothetical protein BGW80DRAFT_1319580 [Lactifluus volemus]